jgi:hypothetical protein
VAIDFPSSPTVGQNFVIGGSTWIWDGNKWVSTGNAPPITSDAGRNLVQNALFNVAQRTGPWTAGGYTADRWLVGVATDTVSFNWFGLVDSDRTGIGDEAATFQLLNTFTGNAAGFNFVTQRIEGVQRLGGKTVTVSFWSKATVAGVKVGVSLDQTFGIGGSPSADVYGNGTAITLTTTWTRYSVTFTLPSTVGKTIGTTSNGYTGLNFWYSAGSQGPRSGNIGTQSGTIQLWGVQLEIGTQATPLEKIDPGDDLRRCQRFYQTGDVGMWGYGVPTAPVGYVQNFPVVMRANPTAVLSAQNYSGCSGATLGWGGPGNIGVFVSATITGGVSFTAHYTASADL